MTVVVGSGGSIVAVGAGPGGRGLTVAAAAVGLGEGVVDGTIDGSGVGVSPPSRRFGPTGRVGFSHTPIESPCSM